jgi:hypothetical protein
MSEKPATSAAAPVGPPAKQDTAKRGTIAYWYAGMILDLVHMPLVIGMVIFGATIWHGETYIYVVTAVVVLQVALLGCPVMWLTGWLKRKHDPAYQGQWSATVWIYQRYGRLVGVGVFAFFLVLALLIRWLFV